MGGHLDGFFKIVGILGLVACFFCGFAASVNGRYRDLRLNEGERFHSDNAYGATANGVERIEKLVRAQRADPTGNPAGWVAAGRTRRVEARKITTSR